ncbi:MAG: oligosaccharide flippase family protein [Elusimicrobia bacterium]|nr:oligosaccharide flippase family protein [Elusimicrobiota bacterium]
MFKTKISYLKQTIKSALVKRISNAAKWSFIGAICQNALMLLIGIVCIHILGKETFGKLGIIRSTIQIFIVLGAVGMGSTATKFIAEFRSKDLNNLKSIYSIVNIISFCTGLISLLFVLLLAPKIAVYLKDYSLTSSIRIGGLLLFFTIINSVQNGILSGLEQFKQIALNTIIGSIAEFICIILGAYFFSLYGALLGYGIGFIVLSLLNHISVRKNLKSLDVKFSFNTVHLKLLKKLIFFSIPLMFSSLLVAPVMWFAQSIVARSTNFSEIAIYSVADQWRMVLLFVPSALSRIVLPILSNLYSDNNMISYLKALKYNIILNMSTTIISFIGLLLFSSFLLKLYGLEKIAIYPMLILGASTIFASIGNVVGQAIISRAKTWIGFLFNLLWGIMIILFTILFLNFFTGSQSLALAVLSSYILHTIFQSIYFYYITKNINTKQEVKA